MNASVLRKRESVRQFSARIIDREVIEAILEEAVWAPSGGNLQPWKVAVLGPQAVRQLLERDEDDSLKLLEIIMKNAFAELCSRDAQSLPANLNEFIVTKMNPMARMSESPPSHMLVVYYQRKTLVRRLKQILAGVSLVSFRLRRPQSIGERLRYLGLVTSRFFRLNSMDRAAHVMSLSNFVYAITLAACARGIDSCIQCHFSARLGHLRRLIRLDRQHDVIACVSLGYAKTAGDDLGVTKYPRARRPVPAMWLD